MHTCTLTSQEEILEFEGRGKYKGSERFRTEERGCDHVIATTN